MTANRQEIKKANRAVEKMSKDWEYIGSYQGIKTTLLLNLPQATGEETGRELHRISKTYRNEASNTIGTYAGLELSVRSEYNITGTFDRNLFFVEGVSGLKYRCGLSGALPLGFVESAQYPQNALNRLLELIEKQRKQIERLESEIPTLQKLIDRKWSKADELSRLKIECKDLQRRIDESLKEAERHASAAETPRQENEAITEAA